MSHRSPRLTRSSSLLIAALVAFVGLAAGPVAHPAPTNAATASYLESLLVRWVNNARENRGIPPLKVGTKLTDLAGDRAATLAKTEKLVHPSCLSCTFNSYEISWSTCGEVIAFTTASWGYNAAHSIFLSWKNSPGHWSLLMSRSFHRLGMGLGYRSSDHSTWASGDLAG
jgi:uncharacterized protein YkwD